ncbi:MAG: 2-amino-4-hydroxy-6-hydroxymethyldihydropteridine diphosphokinase [Pseudomonadota bacterium]
MTNTTRTALIGLGSNKSWLGQDPESVVRGAAAALSALGQNVTLSSLYDSPAWPDPAAPSYVNGAASVETTLPAEAVLQGLLAIEAAFGRVRSDKPEERYAPRTLDLDLLAVADERSATAHLTLPHHGIEARDFVLLPLADIAPQWRHPVSGKSVAELIAALPAVTAQRRG